jgi:acyl carrier protein
MDKEEIIKTLNSLFIEEFEIDEKMISPGARLKDDLGLESLDFVDIAVIVKKKFGITMKGKDVVSMKTAGNLYDYIYDKIKKN